MADANDTQVDGWVCDHGHQLVELKSPWDWPGFDLATLSAPVSDMFQRALFIAQDGTPDEITSFEEAFNSVQSDATVKKLEDAIDKAGQHDGKITAQELKAALGKPWLADRIDHLIVKYESEWGGDMSKWDALDSHMQAGLPVWQAEKTRIEGGVAVLERCRERDGFPVTSRRVSPASDRARRQLPVSRIEMRDLRRRPHHDAASFDHFVPQHYYLECRKILHRFDEGVQEAQCQYVRKRLAKAVRDPART